VEEVAQKVEEELEWELERELEREMGAGSARQRGRAEEQHSK
jgi:hypothetical protein